MKKLENALRTCRKFYQTYEKQIRIAVIALTVITALLLFGGNGKNNEIVVDQTGEIKAEMVVEDPDLETKDEEMETPTPKLVTMIGVLHLSR